jgi:type VI secretion system secreted protein VgrG
MAVIGFTQTDRALKIDTPLKADTLILRSISGQEAISHLFRFQLELLSENDAIQFDQIVGKTVTLHIETAGSERLLNGVISRFSQGGRNERFTFYHAEMVPWLWFLTRTADCRIFQGQTAPQIIKEIFGDLKFDDPKFPDFELRLYKSYRQREFCVQYRETDFNFVSRLMEEEGIYYFFEHDSDKHTLVLADDAAAHKPCVGQPKARCEFASAGSRGEDMISDWRAEQEYRPSAWAHTDYNFETPSTNLMVTAQDHGNYEIYDFPGTYSKKADGDQLAKTRLQETLALKERVTGKSNCRCFSSGSTVEVTDHYRDDMNQKWLLTSVNHQSTMGEAYGSGGEDEGVFYTNTFQCIPASVQFRPPRVTPKPDVQGCQTAIVVGPKGEEIHTDKYGRVRVQFHWDRKGENNEHSSCWIRVSHPWAGKNWGGIHIPRIGQEVVVDFLEGDPDQPLIVGRVYHAENMPPWALDGKKAISGFKSDSTKGGGGYNEFSMDDTKGNELIQVHAQFDQDIKVEHDERTNIGRNRTESVGNDETITIGANRTETVGDNETITIGANRVENVGQNETVTVNLLRTHNVGVNDMLNVGATQEVSIGGAQALTVGLGRAESVGLGQQTSVGKVYSLQAGDSIVLKTGAASITLKSDGTIIIAGKDITLNASGGITEKASGDIVMKGSKIAQN